MLPTNSIFFSHKIMRSFVFLSTLALSRRKGFGIVNVGCVGMGCGDGKYRGEI